MWDTVVYSPYLSRDLIKSDSGIMWWDEAAPRKVNVKLSIVGRKKEFIHKFDLVFETDEVHTFEYMSGKCYVHCIRYSTTLLLPLPTHPSTQPARIKLDVMHINLKDAKKADGDNVSYQCQ